MLELVELQSDGIQSFGLYNSSTGINITRSPDIKVLTSNDASLQNRTFIVLTALVRVLIDTHFLKFLFNDTIELSYALCKFSESSLWYVERLS